jgi:hypothetical protein
LLTVLTGTGFLSCVVGLSTSTLNTEDEVLPKSVTVQRPEEEETIFAFCQGPPCYTLAKIHVPMGKDGFPSFLDYAHRGPVHVDYNSRALKLNGKR